MKSLDMEGSLVYLYLVIVISKFVHESLALPAEPGSREQKRLKLQKWALSEKERWNSKRISATGGASENDVLDSGVEEFRKATVDVLVVVDYETFQGYQKKFRLAKAKRQMTKYYTQLMSLVDTRYNEIHDDEFSINVRVADVIVAESRAACPWVENNTYWWTTDGGQDAQAVDPNDVLKSLQSWLTDDTQKQALPPYDHVMAFTSYLLVKKERQKPSSGMAYISTICRTQYGFSTSIIEELGGFANVGTATHELGHSLGATHDGEGDNKGCPSEHGYIMSPASSILTKYEKNFFSFSECSIRQFKAMIRSDQARCLLDSKPDKTPNKLPGEWINIDRQCKDVFGDESGQCQIPDTDSEDICRRLWCRKPGTMYSCVTKGGLHAVHGTKCAQDKVCYNGDCILRSNLPHKKQSNSNELQETSGVQSGLTTKLQNGGSSRRRALLIDSGSDQTETVPERKAATKFVELKPKQTTKYITTMKAISTMSTTASPTTKTNKQPIKAAHSDIKADKFACPQDTNEFYCRHTVYQHPDACNLETIRHYCCFSCSFIAG